jgi:hypothetical protein
MSRQYWTESRADIRCTYCVFEIDVRVTSKSEFIQHEFREKQIIIYATSRSVGRDGLVDELADGLVDGHRIFAANKRLDFVGEAG